MTQISIKRIFVEKRRLAVPVLAGLALNILVYAGVVYPMRLRVGSVERRASSAAQMLAAAQREHAEARSLVESRDRTGSSLAAFYREVLPESPSKARRITHIELNKLAEQHRLVLEQREMTPPEGDKQDHSLARLRTGVRLRGGYEDIRQFIYELEAGNAFIVIDSLNLVEGDRPGGSLTVSLGLSTYYRRQHGA